MAPWIWLNDTVESLDEGEEMEKGLEETKMEDQTDNKDELEVTNDLKDISKSGLNLEDGSLEH